MHRLGKGNAYGNQHRASCAGASAVENWAGDRRLRSGDYRFGDIVSAHHQQFLGFARRYRLRARAHRHDRVREGKEVGQGPVRRRRGDERHRIRRGAGHAKHVQLCYR